jgi:small subunit ribosomal protein S5
MSDSEEKKNTEEKATEAVADTPKEKAEVASRPVSKGNEQTKKGGTGGQRDSFTKNRRTPRRTRRQGTRARPEFDHKIASIRRVSRVVAGGRRFSFSVAIIAGDKRGRVGVGTGKATDTALAIEKALRSAKKAMITVPRTEGDSISRPVSAKWVASNITLRPAPGRGLVAGSSVRTTLELAGVSDVSAKIISRSKSKLNNAQATIEALKQLSV